MYLLLRVTTQVALISFWLPNNKLRFPFYFIFYGLSLCRKVTKAIEGLVMKLQGLKSIGYISLCGYEGLSHDVTNNEVLLNFIHSSFWWYVKVSSNLDLVYQSEILSSGSKLRSVSVQCDSEIQLKQEFIRFLDDLYDADLTEPEHQKLPHCHQYS